MRIGIGAPLLLLAFAFGGAFSSPHAPTGAVLDARGPSLAIGAPAPETAPGRIPSDRTVAGLTGFRPYIAASAPGPSGAALSGAAEPLPARAAAIRGRWSVTPAAALRLPLPYRPQAPPS